MANGRVRGGGEAAETTNGDWRQEVDSRSLQSLFSTGIGAQIGGNGGVVGE